MTDERSVSTALQSIDRTAPVALAAVAAVAVAAVHGTVFEHLSVNHDEGVYLQQAAMLLEGQLVMRPGDIAGAVRPWFFVRDGGVLYPKYTPVTAAVFAAGKLLTGSYATALPAVAFAVVLLSVRVVEAAFDRRTGLVAGALVAGSPLFLVTTATFLSYAPATALNLLFALSYVRAVRDTSTRWAGVAGVAVGLAFFARPYTAVLFAAPFVAHALVATAGAWRTGDRETRAVVAVRNATVATLGLAFVALALAYNWRLTGSPLRFPYVAFAPQDGIGFGHREILAHDVDYTVAVALRTNAVVLWRLLTEWFVAPPVGALLAVGGAGAFVARLRNRWYDGERVIRLRSTTGLSDDGLRLLVAGVAASVVVGNLAFWGNRNVLGNPAVRGDGLIDALGPFYHFDLLLPLSAFAAHGALLGWGRLRAAVGSRSTRRLLPVAVAAALVVAPLVAVDAAAVRDPLEHNAGNRERLDRVYGPIDERSFDRALVFVPTPYGDWLNHPFQRLRNDPDLEGPVVYALDRGPDENLAVVDAFPRRSLYRFTYRGRWGGHPGARVTPKLEPLRVVEGDSVQFESTLGVPEGASVSSVRLAADGEARTYRPDTGGGDEFAVTWAVTPRGARVTSGVATGSSPVPVDGATELSLAVTLVQAGGATLTYRQDLTVDAGSDGVRVVWPPETRVCRLTPDCGLGGTYLPNHSDEHLDGASVDANVTVP